MANNNTYKRPVIVWGNSFYINISLEKFNAGAYKDFDLTKATDLKVYLICATHNTEIPLPYEILQGFDNVLRCFVDYRLLHTTSYGVVVEGYDEQDMHFRFEMLPKEGFIVVNNTSGMSITDDVQVVDISARVGWGISYNGDLTNYYTKSEVDNLIAEIEISLDNYYTKEEINQLVNQFPTKSEIDTRFNDYYTKTQVNGLISGKQDTLVSGSNIKTINNESILGSGNIDIQGGGTVEPIIVNYEETISNETLTKIREQKTNVIMYDGYTSKYIPLETIHTTYLRFTTNQPDNHDTFNTTIYTYTINTSRWNIQVKAFYDTNQIKTALDEKQDTLISGTNIKTINNLSLLGEGNIDIQGGGGGDYSEQFKTTADALWDLDHRINKNEYVTNKKLESIENSTKDTLDEFGDSINEQLSVAANTLIEHSGFTKLEVTNITPTSKKGKLRPCGIVNLTDVEPISTADNDEHNYYAANYIRWKTKIQENLGSGAVVLAFNGRPYGVSDTSIPKASGAASICAGLGSKALGLESVAMGRNTIANGVRSIALGDNAETSGQTGSFACGRYSLANTDTQFAVGNGGGSKRSRHNALEIKQNGDIYYADTEKIDGSTVHYYDAPMIKLQDAMVTSTTAGLKIAVVSALPASPDANTIYIIQ